MPIKIGYNGAVSLTHKEKIMGHVFANITLANSFDSLLAQRGDIPPENVRQMKVKAMVDSGARTLTINEEIAQQLGLPVQRQLEVVLADGSYRIPLPDRNSAYCVL
ncbi:MAG: retroviral-like aspartic protease family protein [Planctomycetaceae bacterium]|jgi:hypothetical protein|nr:retroviral-like aspartic protease family protein [Planctomycetaceae bacterium]